MIGLVKMECANPSFQNPGKQQRGPNPFVPRGKDAGFHNSKNEALLQGYPCVWIV